MKKVFYRSLKLIFVPISASIPIFGDTNPSNDSGLHFLTRLPLNNLLPKETPTSDIFKLPANNRADMKLLTPSLCGSNNVICAPVMMTGLSKFSSIKDKTDEV